MSADYLLKQLLGGARVAAAFKKDDLLDELKKASVEPALDAKRPSLGGRESGRFFKQPQWVRQETILTKLNKKIFKIPRDQLPTLLVALYLGSLPFRSIRSETS